MVFHLLNHFVYVIFCIDHIIHRNFQPFCWFFSILFFILRLCASFVWLACALFLFLFNRTLSLSCYLIFCGVRAWFQNTKQFVHNIYTKFHSNISSDSGKRTFFRCFCILYAKRLCVFLTLQTFFPDVCFFVLNTTHPFIHMCEKHKRIRQEYFENWRWRKKDIEKYGIIIIQYGIRTATLSIQNNGPTNDIIVYYNKSDKNT